MYRKTLICLSGILQITNVFAGVESRGVSPFGELTRSHISRGYIVSTDTHPGADYVVISSIAETLTGVSNSSGSGSTFSVSSGLLKPLFTQPSAEVIFLNGFE